MPYTVLMAVGARRGKAEEWIRTLPERFPNVEFRIVSANNLKGLADTAGDDESVILVSDTPYAEITKFRLDAAGVLLQGGLVFLQYFPGEPLISLIQADQRSPSLLGAESLRADLQDLQDLAVYEAELDELEERFADRLVAKKKRAVLV